MATTIDVENIVLEDPNGSGPVTGVALLRIADNAVNADAAAEGAGRTHKQVRVRLTRAKFNALLADLRRPNGETLTGALDAQCPIARDP